jgi:hypothetical protein
LKPRQIADDTNISKLVKNEIIESKKDLVRKAINELVSINQLPTLNALERKLQAKARYGYLKGIITKARVEYKEEKSNKVLTNVMDTIERTPVTCPITLNGLARRIGTTRWSLKRKPTCLQLIQLAKEKSRVYWSSFSCQNDQCSDYGLKFTGRIKVRINRAWKQVGLVILALLYCTTCRKYFLVNVEAAPLHRDFQMMHCESSSSSLTAGLTNSY